jgi:hypothetical protein
MKSLARPADRDEIVRRLRTLRPDSVRRWGRMSAHQMVCHLADAFRMVFGELAVSDDTNALKRTVLKWVVLRAPLRWPAGILTRPELDQDLHGTKPSEFANDLAAVETLMARFVALESASDWRPHPFFGVMSPAEWLRWGYLHADHHLRQFGA